MNNMENPYLWRDAPVWVLALFINVVLWPFGESCFETWWALRPWRN